MFCTPQPFRQQVNQHRLLQKISNMAETQGPRMVYAKINKTLAEIGLNVQQVIIASPVANCQSQQPDDFHQTMVDNNKSIWWLVVTAEELNKLAPIAGTTARVINSLPGNLRMDSFDKVILSPSPTGAVTTMFYHLVEQHVSTREPNRFYLVAFNPDFQQTMLRLANTNLNLFARGYNYPQMQIEANKRLRFNTFELASQQVWEIGSTDDRSFVQTVHDAFNWRTNYIWTYNIAINLAEVTSTDHPSWRATIQALAYSGLQSLNEVDTEVANNVKKLLATKDPANSSNKDKSESTQDIGYGGSKTVERLRGSTTLMEFLNSLSTEDDDAFMDEQANMEGNDGNTMMSDTPFDED